jgi:hypothetical protein
MCDYSLFLLVPLPRGEISVTGEGCDTPSVTVAATVLNNNSLCNVEA